MTDPLDLLRRGAQNAVSNCMGITANDRVFIISDHERARIGQALLEAAQATGAAGKLIFLEDFQARPVLAVPEKLRDAVFDFQPTVTFYAATSKKGEITFRIDLRVSMLQKLQVRHGHMIGIDERLMQEGMTADYDAISVLTQRVWEIARQAKSIRVTSPNGTDLTATFNPQRRWVPCTGIYHKQGQWGNLPEGETFTCPETANGVIAASVLGDYFSEKYGILPSPLFFHVTDGYITNVTGNNDALVQEVLEYVSSAENGRRMGEFAIGTNTALNGLTGNLLQDEKLPGVHAAFGDSYAHETGADWDSKIHVDVIPTECTIAVDGRVIMVDGKFTL